jgi:GTP-binding protein
MSFRDTLTITVQGGKGGDGAVSFLRLKYIPKGGPDGGGGGGGGSVLLEAVDDVTSLDRLVGKRFFRAGAGQNGAGRDRMGRRGEDLVVQVPVGTLAIDLEDGRIVSDLNRVGQRELVAEGGSGGRGNASFASSVQRSPRFAEHGTPGAHHKLSLELRMISDVGLVGYPNAGKSSLLACLSNARPTIASYPFTTLSPNLGVVEGQRHRFTVADIPGIITDAHLGKGLGIDFLRHISRNRLLVFVLDIDDDPTEKLESLLRELRAYDRALLDRTALIVLNKVDLVSEQGVRGVEGSLTSFGLPIFGVSALNDEGVGDLREALIAMLPVQRELEPIYSEPKIIVSDPVRIGIHPTGLGWCVIGDDLEKVVSRFDCTNRDVVAYLQQHFVSLGLPKLLKRAGAKDGDDIHIGEAVFEYLDELTDDHSRHSGS